MQLRWPTRSAKNPAVRTTRISAGRCEARSFCLRDGGPDDNSSFPPGESEKIRGLLVSGNYFSVLGAKIEISRAFLSEEDQAPGAHPVVVLSLNFWHRRLGADPTITKERMNSQIRNRKAESDERQARCWDFGLRASFGFRHSDFVIVQSLLTSAATEL